jgi:hypothetical protein
MLVDAKPAAHWTTQAFGLALISAALLTLTILGLVLFGGEDTAFFGLITAVAVFVTVVVWRFDKAWARALGVLATLGATVTMFLARIWVVPGVQPYRVHRRPGIRTGSGSVPRRGDHGAVLEEKGCSWSNQT